MNNDTLKEFKQTIKEICDFYKKSGIYMDELSEGIGIEKRTLQSWKSDKTKTIPNPKSIDLLCDYLENHNGNYFAMKIKKMFGQMITIDIEDVPHGKFPDNLSPETVKDIRDNFPVYKFICILYYHSMYGNKFDAAKALLPEDGIEKYGNLIANYDSEMKRVKKIYGFKNLSDWEDKIMKYATHIPIDGSEIETIGQEALDNVIYGYLSNKPISELTPKERRERVWLALRSNRHNSNNKTKNYAPINVNAKNTISKQHKKEIENAINKIQKHLKKEIENAENKVKDQDVKKGVKKITVAELLSTF